MRMRRPRRYYFCLKIGHIKQSINKWLLKTTLASFSFISIYIPFLKQVAIKYINIKNIVLKWTLIMCLKGPIDS